VPSPGKPTQAQIESAIAQLKADPNFAGEHAMRTLKWVDSASPRNFDLSWLDWLRELFGWIAQSGRILLWVAGAILAALLALYIYRLVREHSFRRGAEAFVIPSFVRDLDIRPESLPADIGAAALALWERGEHRTALALLYRGLLSRLAHVYGVPIRDSSTEGDCLALAALHLTSDRELYATALVRIWQRAVYGGQDPDTAAVAGVCTGFSRALDPAPDRELAGQAA
jgi:hypothetical protein